MLTASSTAHLLRATAARLLRYRAAMLLVLLHLWLAAPAIAEPLQVGPAARYLLGPSTYHLVDPRGFLGIANVVHPDVAAAFRPSLAETPNFGFTRAAVWLRTELLNTHDASARWILEVGYPLLDQVDLYVVRASGATRMQRGGDTLPFAQRAAAARHINFELELPPGEPVTLYLRVRSGSSVQMPLVLWEKHEFYAADREEQLVLGLYYGVLVAMLAFSTMVYFSTRSRAYLFYVGYLVCYALLQLSLNGLAFQYLWPRHPLLNEIATTFFVGTTCAFAVQFSRSFLDLARHSRVLDRASLGAIAASIGVALAAPAFPYGDVIQAATGVGLVGSVVILCSAVVCLLKKEKQALYLTLAWTIFLVAIVVFSLKTMNVLPTNFFTQNAMQFGSALEAVMLGFALTHRYKLLMEESGRLQAEAAANLEAQVRRRTAELNQALQQLSTANASLEDLSQRDPLTRARNRLYLTRRFEALAGRIEPLSLLLLDIDHFKRINDLNGHGAGDACLHHLCDVVGHTLRGGSDELVRWGGEEFAVLLPGTTSEDARTIGERLRIAIETAPAQVGDRRIAFTVSVGVASAAPDTAVTLSTLVAQADAALYGAKHGGRNRVCTGLGLPLRDAAPHPPALELQSGPPA
ncbi:sensor domain-containing diguanylate cyclase [Schlegelella sp. S2-27]|uniref:diguanylate cyclase n=1 Tax=Caldimonas mangrovi TaxID=2944811 RepID=A0ABT0YI93_9BURK|nr:diguanylate cyclase [Caldimonas mangrovi]MCM5678440.1 sensor domain-containing diguanylate cyclase [Caldimonas mangrovi]